MTEAERPAADGPGWLGFKRKKSTTATGGEAQASGSLGSKSMSGLPASTQTASGRSRPIHQQSKSGPMLCAGDLDDDDEDAAYTTTDSEDERPGTHGQHAGQRGGGNGRGGNGGGAGSMRDGGGGKRGSARLPNGSGTDANSPEDKAAPWLVLDW